MSDDKNAKEEVYGISSAVEDRSNSVGGAKQRHGAKTKEVLNVSDMLSDLFKGGILI
jgi:hypothetical protein